MVRIAFSSISSCSASIVASVAITFLASSLSRRDKRMHGIGDLPFGETAHLRDLAGELLQIDVESLGGMLADIVIPRPRAGARFSRSGR